MSPGFEPVAPAALDPSHRARRRYFTRRRHDILAPVNALRETTRLMLADAEILAHARLAQDLHTVAHHAERLAEMVESRLGPDGDEELAAKALNHDLRGVLTILIGYGDDLHRHVRKKGLERCSTTSSRSGPSATGSWRWSTARSSSSAPRRRPLDDLQGYLDRVASQPDEPEGGPGRTPPTPA
ncbi:MAG: hypothetical protein U0835_19825 [Isosphaeraceae bacterium]